VHAQSVTFSVLDASGRQIGRDVVETNGQALVGYDPLCSNGTKPNLAKVTVARKIAAIVRAMWKTEERYEPGRLHRSAIGGPLRTEEARRAQARRGAPGHEVEGKHPCQCVVAAAAAGPITRICPLTEPHPPVESAPRHRGPVRRQLPGDRGAPSAWKHAGPLLGRGAFSVCGTPSSLVHDLMHPFTLWHMLVDFIVGPLCIYLLRKQRAARGRPGEPPFSA